MSEYTHRMTLIVPDGLIFIANQLALTVGESPKDISTFVEAGWQDNIGNKYALCSTAIKPIVLDLLGKNITDTPFGALDTDIVTSQTALSCVVIYEEGIALSDRHIIVAIDDDPHEVIGALKLTPIAGYIL